MIVVDLVTPVRKLVEGATTAAVKLPGEKGEMEILPGHTEMLTLLKAGILSFQSDGVQRVFAISFGFAEVRDDKVIICAETAEEASEIDKDRAVKAQKKAEEALSSVLTEEHFNKYQLKLERSLIRQSVAR